MMSRPDTPAFRVAGVVLSGGASRRMGTPKALLSFPDGSTLAARQLDSLAAAGCSPCRIVTGAHHDEIAAVLGPERCIRNPDWSLGRASSLQAAVRALPDVSGWLFLPVDAAGIRPDTLRALLDAAKNAPGDLWRPSPDGLPGFALYLPSSFAPSLLSLSPSTPLDAWTRPRQRLLPLADPALRRNLNTPADWQSFLSALPS